MSFVRVLFKGFRGAILAQPSAFAQRCTLYTSSRRTASSDLLIPTNFQRKILVWTKFYPNSETVPSKVSMVQMKKATDLFRVRLSILMVVFFAGAFTASALWGRHRRDIGDTSAVRAEHQIRLWQEAGRAKREAVAASEAEKK